MYDFLCKFQEKNFISSFEFDYNNVMKEFYNILKTEYGDIYFALSITWDEYQRFYYYQIESNGELEYNWWKQFIYNQYDFIFHDSKNYKLFLVNVYNGTVPIDFITSYYSHVDLGQYLNLFFLDIICKIFKKKFLKYFSFLSNSENIWKKIINREFKIFLHENGFLPRMTEYLIKSLIELFSKKFSIDIEKIKYNKNNINKEINSKIENYLDLENENSTFFKDLYDFNEINQNNSY
jgi:hypothetical protein